jgi:hypothetical protein
MDLTIKEHIDLGLTHSVHVSERRSFRGCRRRWDWVYRELYYPLTTPKPLEFGIAYHLAAEHWYHPDTWGIDDESRELETLEVFRLACKTQLVEYAAKVASGQVTQFATDDEVEQDYKERIELGIGMLRQMFKQSYELDAPFRPRGVEVKFEVPLLDPSTKQQLRCTCRRCWKKWTAYSGQSFFGDQGGLPVTYGGRIDALFEDSFGRVWVVDWKTAARLSTGEPNSQDNFLLLDDQITSYCWALYSMGVDVAGFIYHEQKKAIAAEPEPLIRPYKGALYSTNKQHDYEHDVYLRTVTENDPSGYASGVYDEFLEYLRTQGGVYYKRHQIHRNEHELRTAGLMIALETLDMISPTLRLYPSPGRFACNGCAFREPCIAQNRGDDYKYTLDTMFERRPKLYYETELSDTDKPHRG